MSSRFGRRFAGQEKCLYSVGNTAALYGADGFEDELKYIGRMAGLYSRIRIFSKI